MLAFLFGSDYIFDRIFHCVLNFMNKKIFQITALMAMIGISYGASSSNNSKESVIDDDAIIAAHAANFAYNVTVNADGEVVLPPGLEGYEVIGDPHLAVGKNKIQAVALRDRDGKKVIRSYRGTSRAQDWMANIGIAYAQSRIINEPIIQHLLAGFKPALAYHGLQDHPGTAFTSIFGDDSGKTISDSLEWAASFVTPLHSAYTGGKNAVQAMKEGVTKTAQFIDGKTGLSKKASNCAQLIEDRTGIKKGTQSTIAKSGSALLTLVKAPLVFTGTIVLGGLGAGANAGKHVVRTLGGIVQDGVNHGGLLSGACTQRQLIFNISRDTGHLYAEYFQDMYEFNQDVINSNEFPEDGAHVTDTGHSLGGNLGMGSNTIANYDGKGGKIVGLSSITFASPNGLLGTYLALEAMGAKESLLKCFKDPTALTAALGKAVVYSHEYDIVPRIGYKESPGNLVFMRTPPHYKTGRKADGITEHHRMTGILLTLTDTHEDEDEGVDADESDSKKNEEDRKNESSGSGVKISETTEEKMLSEQTELCVAKSRVEFMNEQAAIRSSVVSGKREAD